MVNEVRKMEVKFKETVLPCFLEFSFKKEREKNTERKAYREGRRERKGDSNHYF